MQFDRSYSSYLFVLGFLALLTNPSAAQFDPPANYYNSATGTGSTLKSQLHNIIDNHQIFSYGAARSILQDTDRDPANSNRMLLVYDRTSLNVSAINPGGSIPGWDSGNSWNREHTWPRSRGVDSSGADTSDLHQLRPSDPDINSDRGSLNFGGAFGQPFGEVFDGGTKWYPGDADAGMIARQQFYMAVRYDGSDSATENLELLTGNPGSQLGDLNRLIEWHYEVAPDSFERRRNDVIYDDYQGNRNPFVDRPEYAWSVFVDQSNDSRITIDGFNNANGASSANVSLGRVLTGAPVPSDQMVTIDKLGNDGTYYEVTTAGAATSTLTGRHNAMRTGGTDSESFSVGLNTSTSTAGQRSGTVTINNLDVTTGGGAGRGANDGDDVFNVTLDVLDHATPSFMGSGVESSLSLDFGQVEQGTAISDLDFSLFNLESTLGFTAGLELDSISGIGDTAILTTDLAIFDALEAGQSSNFTASIDTSSEGIFGATYTLSFSDEDLPGGMSLGSLSLELVGEVVAVAENADFNESGLVDALDLLTWQAGFGSGDSLANGDANSDQSVNGDDLAIWQTQYGTDPSAPASLQRVPEPSTLGLALISLISAIGYRRK